MYRQPTKEPDHLAGTETPHCEARKTSRFMGNCRCRNGPVIRSMIMCVHNLHVHTVEKYLNSGPIPSTKGDFQSWLGRSPGFNHTDKSQHAPGTIQRDTHHRARSLHQSFFWPFRHSARSHTLGSVHQLDTPGQGGFSLSRCLACTSTRPGIRDQKCNYCLISHQWTAAAGSSWLPKDRLLLSKVCLQIS